MSSTGLAVRSFRATTVLERYRPQILTVVFSSLLVWFCSTWFLTIERVIRYYNPFPAWDYWRIPYDAFFYKLRGFQIFFKPHNEHRVIFPEIIWQLDLLLRGRLILPIVFGFFCYFGTWLMLTWIISRDRSIRPLSRVFAVLLAGVILGWQGSAVAIGDPFLLQWTLSTLCVVMSVWLVGHRESILPALIAAVVATYSSGNCLLLWPVLLLEAWALRVTRRRIGILAITGALSIAIYFIGYHPNSKLDLAGIFVHPLLVCGFFVSYIAMPFGLGKSDTFAICLGAANISLVMYLSIYARRHKVMRSRTLMTLLCIYLFTLLTAALTTLGRINWAGGYGEAKASRYWTIQLLNWAVVSLLCVYVSDKARSKMKTKAGIAVLLIALVGFGTFKLRSSLSYDDNQFANRQLAALSFENGLEDTCLARRIFPDPAFVFSLVPLLRNRHLSIYSLPDFSALGKPAQVAGKVVSEPRSGAIISATPVIGGIELIGWADPERDSSEKIVLVNENREIVGFGRKLPATFPSDLRSLTTPAAEAWVGFVNLKYGGQFMWPFFLTHGRLQPIGSAIPVKTDLKRVRGDTGVLLTGLEWHMDPAWTRNGLPPFPFPDNLPHGAIYASWSGDYRKQGKIVSSPFTAPASGCVLLPLTHGVQVQGLSLQIVNADTSQVIQTIPMQNGDLGWQFWKLLLDRSISHLSIIARDQGSDWGEWLAIAQPSACEASDP